MKFLMLQDNGKLKKLCVEVFKSDSILKVV